MFGVVASFLMALITFAWLICMSFLEFILKVTICLSPANLSGKMAAEQGDEGRMELRSYRNEFTHKENMFLFEIMGRLTKMIWLNTFCLV